MGEYSFLSNPLMVRGTMDGALLTLWTQNELVKGMISKPGILAVVSKVAQEVLGAPCRVVVTVGVPPAQSPGSAAAVGVQERGSGEPDPAEPEGEVDKLDELLAFGEQFGNIITEE